MTSTRYVGLDVHKRHEMVAAVDEYQQLILKPTKVAVSGFATWAGRHLLPTDHVALEATSNAWEFHDRLIPLVASVSVANSHKLRLISASSSKTDKHDALVLAKLLAAHLLPAIWVPPQHVRGLRQLTVHRAHLIEQRTAAKNRLHAILHQHNLQLPVGNAFTSSNESWWETLPLTTIEQLQVRHFWASIHHLNQLIAETEARLAQLSAEDPWCDMMTFIMQLPGIGLYTGMTVLAAIGDIQRFPTPNQLVGYAGLGVVVRESGDTRRTGKITKRGRHELRTALINCAWVAVRWSDYWRALYQKLAKRIGKNKAITAIARKLLVVMWHVLTKQELDRHPDVQAIARSFMTWCSYHHLARSRGVRRIEFVRQRLERLGIAQQVSAFRANGRTYTLPITP